MLPAGLDAGCSSPKPWVLYPRGMCARLRDQICLGAGEWKDVVSGTLTDLLVGLGQVSVSSLFQLAALWERGFGGFLHPMCWAHARLTSACVLELA